MSEHYLFPKTKFAGRPGLIRQLFHVASEFFEVVWAIFHGNPAHACHECYDLIGSVETLIRKLHVVGRERAMPVHPAKIRLEVEIKNRSRGYYEQ